MQRIIVTAAFLAMAGLVAGPAFAQDAAASQMPFISINMVADDGNAGFEKYIDEVLPIMEAYNSTFAAYDVEQVLGGDVLENSVVTFGSFGSREESMAFNQDPAFQAIFPELLSATENHITVFPNGGLPDVDSIPAGGDLLLTMIWTDGTDEDVQNFNHESNARLASAIERSGGTQLGEYQGFFASEGLGPDMQQIDPPQLVEIWHFADFHGFLNSPEMAAQVELPFNETRGIYLVLHPRRN